MPDQDGGPAPRPATTHGVWGNFILGLKVLGAELRWLAVSLVRRCEARQVRRRLEAEYAALGRLAREHLKSEGKAPMSPDGEAGLAVSQIDFLEQEIAFLDKELGRAREDELAKRRRELDPEDA